MENKIGIVKEPFQVDFVYRAIPPLKEDEVLIKVVASAICGSDVHIFKGKHPSVGLPATIGHEFSGTVEQIGNMVTNVAVKDRVTIEPCIVCGTCEACRHGEYSACENISFTYRNGDGSMSHYVVAKANFVYEIPDTLSFEEGCLIEPLSVATHAVRRADVKLGDTVLVIGTGAIGLLIVSLCKLSGASQIIAVNHSKSSLEIAKKYGATRTICSQEESVEEVVASMTNGKGVQKSFECVGKESTFIQAMMNLKKNGLATVIGIFEEPNITIPATRFITHEIKMQGSQGYCWDFPIAIQASSQIDLSLLITHEFGLDQLQDAFETCLNRKNGSVKVIIKP